MATTTDIYDTKWEKFEELLSNDTYKGYPVEENLDKIYDIGEYKVAYKDKDKTYYLSMTNEGKPVLKSSDKDAEPLKKMVSWPMCGKDYKIDRPLEKQDYQTNMHDDKGNPIYLKNFPTAQGIEKPVLHPQFVFLGMNWSAKNAKDAESLQKTSHIIWENGFSQQARIVLDSVLSGGYFTDFIKFYKETILTSEDLHSLYLTPEKWEKRHKGATKDTKVKVIDGEKEYDLLNSEEKPVTWFEVYENIFRQELDMLEKAFQRPEYIIIWGAKLYNFLHEASMNVHGESFCKRFSDYKVRVFGCHYAGSSCGQTFPLDKTLRQSCRRIYEVSGDYSQSVMKEDRREDKRRYEFALLEDANGDLVPYKGNTDK